MARRYRRVRPEDFMQELMWRSTQPQKEKLDEMAKFGWKPFQVGECMLYLKNGLTSVADLESSKLDHHVRAAQLMRRFKLVDTELYGCPITQLGYALMSTCNVS